MSAASTVRPALFDLLSQLTAQKETLSPSLNANLEVLNKTASLAGIKLFGLNAFDEAERYLTIGAAGGCVLCQFYMATCHALQDGIWYNEDGTLSSRASEETRKWLNLAAAQNYVPALIQLGDTASLEKAKTLVKDFSREEAPNGMYYMYLITNDISWLEKSAAAGWDLAKFKLAEQYRRKPSLIANEALRLARIEELYQESADAGLPLAMYARVFATDSTANLAEKQTRLAHLARDGHLRSMLEYGYALANIPNSQDPVQDQNGHPLPVTNRYGLATDLPVAYAYLQYVHKNLEGPITAPQLPADLHHIERRMTPSDKQRVMQIFSSLDSRIFQLFSRVEDLIIPGTAK